jgi:thioredoxin 1
MVVTHNYKVKQKNRRIKMPKILGNSTDFEKHTQEGVTLVDFYADWCGPCQNLSPTLDELEGKYEGKLSVLKVNVDDNQELAQKFGVRGIPALFFLKDGQVQSQLTGLQPLSTLEEHTSKLI